MPLLLVPVAVLLPPSRSVRSPSSPKLVELNAAPPVANVVPDPLCVPPENDDAPVAVSVPEPFSVPPVWARALTAICPLSVNVPLVIDRDP